MNKDDLLYYTGLEVELKLYNNSEKYFGIFKQITRDNPDPTFGLFTHIEDIEPTLSFLGSNIEHINKLKS